MKLISQTQQAKVRQYFEITASGILSIIMVSVTIAITTPGSYLLIEKAMTS
ncbi:MAG: hypothetical protein ACRBCS_06345 [Cellvibrionaceae bacterium]